MGFQIIDPNLSPKIISKDKNFKIVILSDTHIGGRTGYLSSGCTHERGEEHPQTKLQKTMEENLLDSLDDTGPVDILITLGDMVDGRNSKVGGLDIGNTNTDVQIEWGMRFARSVIDILKPKYILGLSGSDYHTDTILDKRLLHRISLEYPDKDVYFGEALKIILGEKLWYLSHKMTEGVSKSGTLERYWRNMCAKTFGRERTPDVIGYGHIHQAQNPYQIKNGENPVYGFICPSQKIPDTFTSKNPMGTFWEIGYMDMEQRGTRLTGEYVNTFEYWKIKQ